MNKFKRMREQLTGLASSPPQTMLALTDETLKQRLTELDARAARLDAALASFDGLEPDQNG